MENISSCDVDDDQIGNLLIPEDALIQILVLLPVISLLRFKSVCKSWRAIIQSSLFIHLHLNTTTNHFGTFIFQTYSNSYIGASTRENEAFMLSGGSGSGSGCGGGEGGEKEDSQEEEEEEELKWENLGFPPHHKVSSDILIDNILMVGSCNGLICIHDKIRREVSLWNPATRQFRLLPKSLNPLAAAGIRNVEQEFVAFGYDVKTNDYKVVQISCFTPNKFTDNRWFSIKEYVFQVQVYSLTTDSWRLLEGITSLPAFPKQHGVSLNHGVYLKNGSYYFLGMYYIEYVIESVTQITTGDMILSFDFTKEIFTTIQLPNDYHGHEMILTCFDEKLAIFVCMVVKEDEFDFKFYDIWVLNEHGVKEEESWTKLHSTVPYSRGFGTPRAISNSGEFALLATVGSVGGSLVNGVYVLNCEQLQLFNLVTKEIKKEFPTGDPVIRADVYKQSLVSIGGNDTTADRVIGGTM